MKHHAFSLTTIAALGTLIALSACEKKRAANGEVSAASPANQAVKQEAGHSSFSLNPFSKKSASPANHDLWKEFSGARAFAQVTALANLGPHPVGSAENETARKIIISELNKLGWDVEQQRFTDQTPFGTKEFVNLIARFAGAPNTPAPADTQRAIVCSHYDTKYFDTIRFIGADDGDSSTGALVELARVLALNPALAQKIELVFFDGEEAFQQWSATDGTYGSRYYAKSLRETGRAKQFEFGILWDMIGQKNLVITLSPDSPPKLAGGIFKSADALNLRDHFTYFPTDIWDDNRPLSASFIPTIDLIDFNYPAWHTADDTLDKLSLDSLQIVGQVTLHFLAQTLGN